MPPSTTQVREAWDGLADGFDEHTAPHTLVLGQLVVDRLPIGAGTMVLDVGAGSGALAIPAARTGAEVLAVDLSPRMLARLEHRAAGEGLAGLRCAVGDAARLEVDDDTVDVAASLNGVTMVPDLAGALRELVRVTRSGGTVAVGAFGPLPRVEPIALVLGALQVVAGDGPPPASEPLPPFRLAGPGAMMAALTDAGLADVTVEELDWAVRVDDADHLLATFTHSNPIGHRAVGALTDAARDELRHVLDGMLRERWSDEAGGVVHGAVLLGSGTA